MEEQAFKSSAKYTSVSCRSAWVQIPAPTLVSASWRYRPWHTTGSGSGSRVSATYMGFWLQAGPDPATEEI